MDEIGDGCFGCGCCCSCCGCGGCISRERGDRGKGKVGRLLLSSLSSESRVSPCNALLRLGGDMPSQLMRCGLLGRLGLLGAAEPSNTLSSANISSTVTFTCVSLSLRSWLSKWVSASSSAVSLSSRAGMRANLLSASLLPKSARRRRKPCSARGRRSTSRIKVCAVATSVETRRMFGRSRKISPDASGMMSTSPFSSSEVLESCDEESLSPSWEPSFESPW
mmetsp:Transcript_23557/g.59718  ORF Transcript_23557/g.59718 Transcript_23557/m.59718 type:complete len:222 (+) Transcript_23557:1591-2256(+)